MATLAFGIAGAALGGTIGPISILGLTFSGSSLGFALGSALGGLFEDRSVKINTILPTQRGPRLGDSRVLTSTFGAPIPKPYGTARIAGNVIWEAPIRERKHKRTNTATTVTEGGKGGGGSSTSTTSQTTITYTYDVDVAIAICEGPVKGVRRIWADGSLIYNVASGASIASAVRSAGIARSISIYLGDETQEADPIIEGHEGVGNVPAHRGLVYIVFNNFQLGDYGNRIPQLEFEVYTGGTEGSVLTLDSTITTKAPAKTTSEASSVREAMHSGHLDSNGAVWFYHVALVNGVNSIKTYRWKASGGKIWNSYRATVKPLTVPMTGLSGTVAIHGQPEIYTDGTVSRTYLSTPGSRSYLIREAGWHATTYESEMLFLDVRTGEQAILQSSVLFIGGNGARPTSTVLHGSRLYAMVTSATGNTTGWGIWTWDLSSFVSGNVITGTRLVAYPNVKSAVLNADSAAWWYNEWDNTATEDGFRAYSHGGTSLQFTSPNPIGTIAHRTDPERNIWRGVGRDSAAVDIVEMTSADGRTDLNASIIQYSGGRAPVPIMGASGVILAPGHMTSSSTQQSIVWGLITIGTPGTVTLQSVLEDLLNKSGLTGSDYDMSGLSGVTVRGFIRTTPTTVRSAIEPLAAAYFFDVLETGNILKGVVRGNNGALTVIADDLGVHEGGADTDVPDEVTSTHTEEIALPRRLKVNFYNSDAAFQQGSQYYGRLITNSVDEDSVELPLALTPTEAIQIAHKLLSISWLERERHSAAVPIKYARVEPGDVVTLQGTDFTRVIQVSSVNHLLPNMLEITGPRYHAVSSDFVGIVGEVPDQDDATLSGPSNLIELDIPLLRAGDDGVGMYFTVTGQAAGWNGAVIFQTRDEGSTWDVVDTILSETFWGSTEGTLASVDNPNVWDRVNQLTILPQDDTVGLTSSTQLSVLNGANAALVGQPGRWEIIGFVNATDNGDDTWTLDTLLRGRGGSDLHVGDHEEGDQFILLDPDALSRISMSSTDIGADLLFRAVSIGTPLNVADDEPVTFEGESSKPWPVACTSGSRDGSNNLTITWLRRSRIIGRPLWVPILGEETESYEVDILDGPGGTVVRTITATTETASYTAAQQTSDGLTPGDPIDLIVYQISAVVGRGKGREVQV